MKIYLAKSNSCDPEVYMRVKAYILKNTVGVELLEYKGGPYTHDDLLSADLMVVIPPSFNFETDKGCDVINTGRGQFEQCMVYANANYTKNFTTKATPHIYYVNKTSLNKILIITGFDYGRPQIANFIGLEKSVEQDWKLNWGNLYLSIYSGSLISQITKAQVLYESSKSNTVHNIELSAVSIEDLTGFLEKVILPHLACINLFR